MARTQTNVLLLAEEMATEMTAGKEQDLLSANADLFHSAWQIQEEFAGVKSELLSQGEFRMARMAARSEIKAFRLIRINAQIFRGITTSVAALPVEPSTWGEIKARGRK